MHGRLIMPLDVLIVLISLMKRVHIGQVSG